MKPESNESARTMNPIVRMRLRARRSMHGLFGDDSGIAAVEFAMIVPLMLVLFFGTVEFSSALAIDRKVTIMARTLSDLVSQNTSVTATQLTNIFNAGTGIMTPYSSSPVNARIVELYIDANLQVHQIWSVTSGATPPTGIVSVPTALKVASTYLIYSEVKYTYVPSIGYVMAKGGITMSDFTYTRPRQSLCVFNPPPNPTSSPCPTS
jgi:Flp pilus assembly protein TadG